MDVQKPILRISLPSGQAPLPPASFPFTFGSSRYQAFHLPTDSRIQREHPDFSLTLPLPEGAINVNQSQPVCRPAEKRPHNVESRSGSHYVDAWIDWQVWAFQELGHLPEEPDEFDAATRSATIRRSWTAASEVWFRNGGADAGMALIVRLSRESTLRRALETVSRHPRRILQRYRNDTPISRIQELDPACIRDYARRPGISALEKAGPRQRLLAVLRRELRDTLENRVACWVMERIAYRAGAYCSENSAYHQDEKVEGVNRFGRNSKQWRSSQWLQDVARLRQVVAQPNYPLQFETRYQAVWETYQRLLKEKREIDDAWAWQRILWGETGRQLIAGCLHHSYSSVAASTPFYRTESRHGFWTELPIAPGPFKTPHGECYILDSRDLDSVKSRHRSHWLDHPPKFFPGAEFLGASGCDQVLFWPRINRALLVWHYYHAALAEDPGGLTASLQRCAAALEILNSDLRRFSQSKVQLSGFLLTADLGRTASRDNRQNLQSVILEPGPHLTGGGAVNALSVPPDVVAWPNFAPDFREGLSLILQELLA
ncbi:MAG TPA: DUF2357 domain-containing protein [Verrucomicrobiae bacterium]|nr:DUF2357 domain-containing protein [Verrucomicrobiae bacterium]